MFATEPTKLYKHNENILANGIQWHQSPHYQPLHQLEEEI
jgi:hypothetical protein